MGLFSFLKNAGTKLFGKKEEEVAAPVIDVAAENARQKELLTSVVRSSGLEIEGLSVDVDGEQVTVYGQAASVSDKEKVILMLGNIEGISTVDDRMSVEVQEPESDFYTVVKGDSLSKIAKEFYGDYMKYPAIFEANKPMLEHPDLIYPGQVLRIPKM
jgi:nucleoid-associated protein YgaU